MPKLLILNAVFFLLINSAFAQEMLWSHPGEQLHDYLGYGSMSKLDDFDNDQVNDLLVGANPDNQPGYALILSGATGATLLKLTGENNATGFGRSTTALSDLNLDGITDFAVTDNTIKNSDTNYGKVYVYSGKDAQIIFSIISSQSDYAFGRSIADAGDVNNDGTTDLIIGGVLLRSFQGGFAEVRSGKDGSLIYRFDDPNFECLDSGSEVSSAGDINLDGYADYTVIDNGSDLSVCHSGGTTTGNLRVFSGIDGSLIVKIGYNEGILYPHDTTPLGDLNQDSIPEILVSGPNAIVPYLRVYNPVDWSIIYTVEWPQYTQFGQSIAAVGDMNLDGVSEIFVGALSDFNNNGGAYLLNGKNGHVLYDFAGIDDNKWLGWQVGFAGDLNHDNIPDLLISDPQAHFKGVNKGEIRAYAGNEIFLKANMRQLYTGNEACVTLASGNPNAPLRMFFSSINGVKSEEHILDSSFDQNGLFSLCDTVEDEWPQSVGLTAYASETENCKSKKIFSSNEEVLNFN